jgi:hypothetical protein
MQGRPKMGDCVLVLGRIATADVTAFHAHPKLKPGIAQTPALLAAGAAGLHLANAIDV